jgi:hypothetical protein
MNYDDWQEAKGLAKTGTKAYGNKTRYLWVRPNSIENPMLIVNNLEDIYRGSQFEQGVDKLYILGEEVKMVVSVEPVPAFKPGDIKIKSRDLLGRQ